MNNYLIYLFVTVTLFYGSNTNSIKSAEKLHNIVTRRSVLPATANDHYSEHDLHCAYESVKTEVKLKMGKIDACKRFASKNLTLGNSKCTNNEGAIRKSYHELEYLFNDIKGLLEIPEYRDVFTDIKVINYTEASGKFATYGDSNCSSDNRTEHHEMSLCPWHYILTYRIDRYPHFQTQVRCNCKGACPFVNKERDVDVKFGCKPILKLQPVLVRGKCVNNTYTWEPALEQVSIACGCMLTQPIVTVDKKKRTN